MPRKILATGLAVAALSTTLTACDSSSDSSSQAADTLTLGYSQPHTDPFQNAEQKGVIRRFKAEGFDYLPATNANRDAAQQITDIRTLINRGAKGLVISVGDADAIVPAIKYANAQRVPIVAIDEAPAGGKIAMIVRADNVALGRKACQAMGKRVTNGQTVLTLDGDPVTSNGRDRTNGFNDCMRRNFPDIKLVHVATQWDTAKAASGLETQFNRNPKIAGVYVQSDATFYPTVVQTMKRIGALHRVGQPGHVTLISVDGSPLALNAIRDGYQDAAIDQPMVGYINYGVKYLVAAIKGQNFQTGPTDHDSQIVDYKGNLADQLPTPVVTADNVDDDGLWGNKPFAKKAFATQ